MASISGLSSAALSLQQVTQSNTVQKTDTDDGSTAVTKAAGRHHHGGGFSQAISQALQSLGLDTSALSSASETTASSDTTSSANSAQDALKQFVGQLFKTLHAQSGSGSEGSRPAGPPPGGPPPAGGGKLADDLKTLLSKLTSGDTSDSDVSALQSSFSNLVSSLGGTSGTASTADLQGFLQKLSSSLSAQSSQNGSIVSTSA